MAENFPNLRKETDIWVQETKRAPRKMTPRSPHIVTLLVKCEKVDIKEDLRKSNK